MIAIAGQAIDAGSYEEMSADLPSRAKQLVNIALPVADVNASVGLTEEFGRLLEVFQPPDAFLLFDGNASRIHLPLERC